MVSPSSPIRVVTLRTAHHRQQAAELYRSVFGYEHPSYGLNPRLLAGLVANGGSVIGALDAHDRLVGFTYGFPGTDGTDSYHYSQAALVAPGLQGKGLGRRLKLAQREAALAAGSTRMRWAYDPMLTRNAHFNLDVLGAVGIGFFPEMYDEPNSDRILVEWDLTAPTEPGGTPEPLPGPDGGRWGIPIDESATAGRMLLPLPSNLAALRTSNPVRAAELSESVAAALTEIFADGYRAVSCRAIGKDACYVFRRPEDPEPESVHPEA